MKTDRKEHSGVRRTLILLDEDRIGSDSIKWNEIGQVVYELSQLYQLVKERRIDLILAHGHTRDMKRPVLNRIRRYNGLTDVWMIVDRDDESAGFPGYIDGTIPLSLGHEGLVKRVKQILDIKQLLSEINMVGRSPRIKSIAESIGRIAVTEVPVLIVGPSGSGKELAAHAIHQMSGRRDKPFVAINCGAIPEGLLESELFGHEKGAFTGSVARREGLFHKANDGSIFLDEIGETKPAMQVKLLRVLEDGTYYPVGSSTPQQADVRIISATNRDLTEAIAEKEFREDLYYRIGVVKLVLPSLLDRTMDIQPLLQHFWSSTQKLDYTDSALDLLMRYDWPGNIRQLRNFADSTAALKRDGLVGESDVQAFLDEQHRTASHLPVATGKTVEEAGQELIYRAILSMGSEIKMLRDLIVSHLPSNAAVDSSYTPTGEGDTVASMEEMEKALIDQALTQNNGNRKETAAKLGIGERTLYRKIKKYDLQ